MTEAAPHHQGGHHQVQDQGQLTASGLDGDRPTCLVTNKLRFSNRHEARAELAAIRRLKSRLPHREECGYYSCDWCGDYHLTSRRRGR